MILKVPTVGSALARTRGLHPPSPPALAGVRGRSDAPRFVGYVWPVTIWLFASALALIAGFAIARGGICAVAGVKQLLEAGRAHLFLSFLECSAWALLALMIANALGLMSIAAWPTRMLVAGAIVGGALFGAGALLNARHFSGGALMGAGAALIPGGNDSLVLIGLPLLQPAAGAAYVAMVSAIA